MKQYTVSGPMNPDKEYITEEQALACLDIVRTYVGGDWEPALYRDHEGPFWNISLEGGPEEWAYRINLPGEVQWPDGVHVETIASAWCIALYPA